MSKFDSPFIIRRKRNVFAVDFLMYLDGRGSDADAWPDREGDIDVENTDEQLAPLGYLPVDGSLAGNLGVNGVTITAFTIGAILSRNEMSNNEGIYYGMFGSTHYPRLYFVGTTLHAQIKLDGVVKEVTIANVDTYMKKGQPHFVVFRGSATSGIEVLIDGVVRGTQTDTGTSFNTGSGDFKLCNDTNLSYKQIGALRFLAVCASRLTDANVAVWMEMLAYEGFFDVWRDNFAKWDGSNSFRVGAPQIASSPYSATLIES